MRSRPRDVAVGLGIAAFVALGARPAAGLEPPSPPAAGPPSPIGLDLSVHLGPSFRLGSAPAFTVADRAGASFGGGLRLEPSRLFSVGLGYEHTGMGSEQSAGDLGQISVARDLDVLWAELGATLVRDDAARLGVVIGPGLAWQSARASGLLFDGLGGRPAVLGCSAGDSANLALRAGLAGELTLGSGFSLTADVMFDHVRLSSDVVGECVPGAGTVTLLAARVGLLYRLDVTRYVR